MHLLGLLGLLNFTSFVSTAGYGAVFVLCVAQSCCVPTSSELTLGFAGALAAQGKLSLPGVIAAGVAGEVLGACIAWMLGRYAGRALVERYGRYVLVRHHDLDRAEAFYERHRRFGVLYSRLVPVIRNFVALPAGIAEVPLGRFVALTAAGSLVWDGAWAGIGDAVGAHWHALASGFSDAGYVLGALALAVIALAVLHRYRSYRRAGSLEEGPAARSRPQDPTGAADAAAPARFLASSSGAGPHRSPAHARRADFPGSPVAAWEAAVQHGRTPGPSGPSGPSATTGPPEGEAGGGGAEVRAEVRAEPSAAGAEGVESNGRLTATLGALLLVLLAIEGFTILRVRELLTLHIVIGMLLVPPVLLKIGSTTWRFARYYLGSPAYRRKGAPPAVLRLLGPLVVASTVAVVGSGIALLLAPASLRTELLFIHKVTFFLWFAAMVVHVLGHLLDVAHLAPKDFYWRTRRQVRGAGLRQWAIVSAVCLGILLGVALAPKVGPWLSGGHPASKIRSHSIDSSTVAHPHP